jgi:hypothetical protein
MITSQIRGHSASTPNKSPMYFGPFIRSQSPGDHSGGSPAPDELAWRIPVGLTFWPVRPFHPLVPARQRTDWFIGSLGHSLVIGHSESPSPTLSNSASYKIF